MSGSVQEKQKFWTRDKCISSEIGFTGRQNICHQPLHCIALNYMHTQTRTQTKLYKAHSTRMNNIALLEFTSSLYRSRHKTRYWLNVPIVGTFCGNAQCFGFMCRHQIYHTVRLLWQWPPNICICICINRTMEIDSM